MTASAHSLPRKFRHQAVFYSGLAEFINGTVPFIRQGIAAAEAVLVVESAHKIDMLRTVLGQAAGSVMFADMAEVGANPARIIPAWQDFVREHEQSGRGLRGIGEPIWKGRTPDELVECQRHESLLNVAFGHGRPWTLLCPYDVDNLPAEVIVEARRSHEFVLDGMSCSQSELYRGIEASASRFDAPLPEPPPGVRQVAFDAESLLALRRHVVRFATGCGFSAERTIRFVTAVNEVASNSVLHGAGRGRLRMWRGGLSLLCEITDAGVFEKSLADRTRPSAAARDPRGLWLANQLCDLVQVRMLPTGTVVRLHLYQDARPQLHVVEDPRHLEGASAA